MQKLQLIRVLFLLLHLYSRGHFPLICLGHRSVNRWPRSNCLVLAANIPIDRCFGSGYGQTLLANALGSLGVRVGMGRVPLCGWFNLVGNIARDTSFAMGFSHILCQFASKSQFILFEVGISVCNLVLWALKNRLRLDKQGWFNNVAAV